MSRCRRRASSAPKSNLHKAELDLARAAELVSKGVGAQAVARHRRRRRSRAPPPISAIAKAQVENAKATLEQRQATLDSARIDLERTYIRSPIDGVVIERTVEAGQTVAASMTAPKLFTIAQDLAHVQIEAQVDEADIGQVTSDNAVSFTVDAYPDVTFKGKVEQIRLAPIALNNVVTYTVVIAADNPLGRLLPGMTANVEIVTGEHKDVVVVPNEALRFQPRGPAQAALARDAWSTGAILTRSGDRAGAPAGTAQGSARARRRGVGQDPRRARGRVRRHQECRSARGRARRKRICASRRACASPRCCAPCSRPRNTRNTRRWQRQRPAGRRRATLWTYEDGALLAA